MRVFCRHPFIYKGNGRLSSLIVNKIEKGIMVVRGRYFEGRRKVLYCEDPDPNKFNVRRFAVKASMTLVDPGEPPGIPPVYAMESHMLIRPTNASYSHAGGDWESSDDDGGFFQGPITGEDAGWYLGLSSGPNATWIEVSATIYPIGESPVSCSCSFAGPPPGHTSDRAI